MLRHPFRAAVLASLALASTAAAASAPVTATLTPDTVSSPSTASITLNGPFSSASGTPSSLSIQIQNGFTASIKSVATLCSASDGSAGTCPAASHVGSGKVVASVGGFGTITIPLTLSMGAPSSAGDIATLYLAGSYDGYEFETASRLLKPSGGGVEILVSKFPAAPAGSSITVTIQSISLSVHAVRTVVKTTTHTTGRGKHKKKHKKTVKATYSFLTNPPACTTGSWTGTATVTYSSGPMTIPFSAPCSS